MICARASCAGPNFASSSRPSTISMRCVSYHLMIDADLEGALLVARGARSEPLTMEELSALERMGQSLAPLSSQFLAAERALKRADETAFERDALRTGLEEARDELARLHAEANLLKAGQAAGPSAPAPVQYSPAMRALMERLLALARPGCPGALDQ